eukprot:m.146369 g.146369  ORF g.146369 m.146369 type:complete len:848 (+) comp14969_c0_seq4:353-2896(+)
MEVVAQVAPRDRTNEVPALLEKDEKQDFSLKVPGYTLGELLGQGRHGEVRKAVHDVSGVTVAIKFLQGSAPKKDSESEIAALKVLQHPHVVRLYDVIHQGTQDMMVLECLPGGELFDYLICRHRLSEREGRVFTRQIVSALDYCHSKGIVHRDLKLENLLLDSNGDIKIADFGFSNIKQDGGLCSTFVGSPAYTAPEILANQNYNGPAADVWSLGVIILTILTGNHPFQDTNVAVKMELIAAAKYTVPDYVSDEARHLILSILKRNPEERLTIKQIAKHQWTTKDMDIPIKEIPEPDEAICNKVFAKMESFGHDSKVVKYELEHGKISSTTATYYLLLDKALEEKAESDKNAEIAAASNRLAELMLSPIPNSPKKTKKNPWASPVPRRKRPNMGFIRETNRGAVMSSSALTYGFSASTTPPVDNDQDTQSLHPNGRSNAVARKCSLPVHFDEESKPRPQLPSYKSHQLRQQLLSSTLQLQTQKIPEETLPEKFFGLEEDTDPRSDTPTIQVSTSQDAPSSPKTPSETGSVFSTNLDTGERIVTPKKRARPPQKFPWDPKPTPTRGTPGLVARRVIHKGKKKVATKINSRATLLALAGQNLKETSISGEPTKKKTYLPLPGTPLASVAGGSSLQTRAKTDIMDVNDEDSGRASPSKTNSAFRKLKSHGHDRQAAFLERFEALVDRASHAGNSVVENCERSSSMTRKPSLELDLAHATRYFGASTTSSLPAKDIIRELKSALEKELVSWQVREGHAHKLLCSTRPISRGPTGSFLAPGEGENPSKNIGSAPRLPRRQTAVELNKPEVSWEMEVCLLPKLGLHGIRMHRVSGDLWEYKRKVASVMSHVKV